MASAKHLNLMMTADSKDAETKLSGIEKSLQRVQAATSGARAAFGSIVGGADPLQTLKGMGENLVGSIPTIGPALQSSIMAGEAFFNKLRESQKGILDVGKSANSVGADIGGYSGLLYAAGGDADMLKASLFHVSEAIGNATISGGESEAVFQRLGLNLNELATMKTDEQFLKVAGALSHVQNSAERNADAMKILGKGAKDAMGLINKGEEGIRAIMARGDSKGKLVNAEDFAAAKQTEEAFKQLDTSVEEVWRTLSLKLGPTMKMIAESISGVGPSGKASFDEIDESAEGWLEYSERWKMLFNGDIFKAGPTSETIAALKIANERNMRKAAIEEQERNQKAVADSAAQAKALAESQKRVAAVNEIIARSDPWGKMNQELATVNAAVKDMKLEDIVKAKDAIRDSFAKPFVDKAMGPFDKLQKDIANLQDARKHLGFSDDVFRGNLASIIDQYKDFSPKELKSPELIEQGSGSEASLIAAQQRERDAKQIDIQSQMKSLLDSIKQKQEETAENTKNMARALENLGLVN